MDDVVGRLQDAAQQLPREDRHHLGDIVMEWEEKFGKNPNLSPASYPNPDPIPVAPTDIKSLRPPPPSAPPLQGTPSPARPPSPPPPAFGTRLLDPAQVDALMRQIQPPVSCPHCGQPNPHGSTMCRACGQMLIAKTAAPTRQLEDTLTKKPTEFFTKDSTLLIAIRGAKGVLEAFPRDKMLIGRGFSPVPGQPFLDLTAYGGDSLGVSRYHVEIRFLNNTLVLTDLDSDNGTFVNEDRVYPYEIRVLHSNDELRLGKLAMKLSFKVVVKR